MRIGRPFIGMQNKVFGRLTVKSFAGLAKAGEYLWNVECSCGAHTTSCGSALRNGRTQSCGCQKKEGASARAVQRNIEGITHGMSNTPTYRTWTGMVTRCTDPMSIGWFAYGGAPIPVTVCSCWLTLEGFLKDMGERPKGTTLGRIVDRGNYESGNAFWMTQAEQNLAKRNNNALRKWEARQCI
jgi:hypothetical protein